MDQSGDKCETKLMSPHGTNKKLLSAGEIDARYMALLRKIGEEELAESFGLRKRFKNDEFEPKLFDVEETEISSEELPLDDDAAEESHYGSFPKVDQQMRWMGASRQILQPEEPERAQPPKMKKERQAVKSEDQSKFLENGPLWVTSDHYGDVLHESYVEQAMKNFVLYLIFLIIVNIITFGVLEHAYNYYATVLSEIITNARFETSFGLTKTFNEIRNVQQIWDFINGVLLKVLYEYGKKRSKSIRLSDKDEILVLFENILIGVPRIRQLRVRNDSCKVQPMFGEIFSTCYYYFSDSDEEKGPFGLKVSTAWTYNEPDDLSVRYSGKISDYGGGGYMMNITSNAPFTRNWIRELITHSWIRQGTRVVFIDFTTYTPNTNLFCVVKLVFEIPPTGGVIPTSHFYTMKFLRYVNTWDHFILGCEIAFVCFVVYYTMEELQQMTRLKEEYWYSCWNILDVAILVMAYAVVATACVRYVGISSRMKEQVSHIESKTHASFDYFVNLQRVFNTSSAVLCFLSWMKLLKFAALNKSVALILSVFGRVKFELFALTLIMLTMVVGFALLANMFFGQHVEQFNTIRNSIFSLVGVFVGGLYFYPACAEARPYLAPAFFVLYIFVVVILFLDAYVALIVHGFHKAVEEFDNQGNRVYLADICVTLFYKILKLVRKDKLATQMRAGRHAKENKKHYDELVDIVKKHGYRGMDLTILLNKHNINATSQISFAKMSQVYNDIDARNQLFLEVEQHDKLLEQIDDITKKVEALDKSIADTVTKVDTLVARHL